MKQGFSNLGEDDIGSTGADKINEECLKQIRELKMSVKIPERKSVSETYPREHPHTLMVGSLERLLRQSLEALICPNLV